MHLSLARDDAQLLRGYVDDMSGALQELSVAFQLLHDVLGAYPGPLKRQRNSALEKLKAKHVTSWKAILTHLLPSLSAFANIHSHILEESAERTVHFATEAPELRHHDSSFDALDESTVQLLERAALDGSDRCGTSIKLQGALLRGWRRYAPWLEKTVQTEATRPMRSRERLLAWIPLLSSGRPQKLQSVHQFTSRIIKAEERAIAAIERIRSLLSRQLNDLSRYRGCETHVKDRIEYVQAWRETRRAIKAAGASLTESKERLLPL